MNDFVNPIDKDKIAEVPSLLPYAHSVGGALVKPEDKGKIKSRALSAMEQQTDMQIKQIQKQIELLASQAKAIKDRMDFSYQIYQAEMGFEPFIGHIYHLYQKEEGSWFMSMIGPKEWGRAQADRIYLASVKLLSDHTWDIIEKAD